jgi:hypothetical protein
MSVRGAGGRDPPRGLRGLRRPTKAAAAGYFNRARGPCGACRDGSGPRGPLSPRLHAPLLDHTTPRAPTNFLPAGSRGKRTNTTTTKRQDQYQWVRTPPHRPHAPSSLLLLVYHRRKLPPYSIARENPPPKPTRNENPPSHEGAAPGVVSHGRIDPQRIAAITSWSAVPHSGHR